MTTATALKLTDERKQLTAKVATWDCFETETYQATDIAAVSIRGDIVWIEFVNGGATAIEKEIFKAKVKEYKAESQLSEEQTEIIEAAIDSPFQSDVNFKTATASFFSDSDKFMGTVRRDRHVWVAYIAENCYSYHPTAESAVQSLTTCTFDEWQQAKAGLEGIRYEGNGWWIYGNGRTNTRNLLDILHLQKSDRQIAILERRIMIADDC